MRRVENAEKWAKLFSAHKMSDIYLLPRNLSTCKVKGFNSEPSPFEIQSVINMKTKLKKQPKIWKFVRQDTNYVQYRGLWLFSISTVKWVSGGEGEGCDFLEISYVFRVLSLQILSLLFRFVWLPCAYTLCHVDNMLPSFLTKLAMFNILFPAFSEKSITFQCLLSLMTAVQPPSEAPPCYEYHCFVT